MDLSFYDILKLEVDINLRDELTLAYLHNIDLTSYVLNGKVSDFEMLREIRLCLEHGVPYNLIDYNLNTVTLRSLRKLYSNKLAVAHSNGLQRYFKNDYYELLLSPSVFEMVVDYTINGTNTSSVDFSNIPDEFVKIYLQSIRQGVDITVLSELVWDIDLSHFTFLVNLITSGIDVTPFLDGDWSEEQIRAVILGNLIIDSTSLIKNYVNEFFTAGQIEQAIRAVKYDCAETVCWVDEDGYPYFNEYQMYNIVEGARFGLDYKLYALPELNDREMYHKRDSLMSRKDEESGGELRRKLRVVKPTSINSDFVNYMTF